MNTFVTTELATDAATAARSLSHPTKIHILSQMARVGDCSPSQMSEILGESASLGVISYHARQLVQLGTIELTETIPRRGALEHRYRISKQGKRDLATLVKAITAIEATAV